MGLKHDFIPEKQVQTIHSPRTSNGKISFEDTENIINLFRYIYVITKLEVAHEANKYTHQVFCVNAHGMCECLIGLIEKPLWANAVN